MNELSSKRNSIKYLRSKLKSSEIQACHISDIASIVTNPFTGPVSLKEGIDDDGPTIHIVMLSKKLLAFVNAATMVYIDGVFKVVSNLQIVLLGIRSPGYFFEIISLFN